MIVRLRPDVTLTDAQAQAIVDRIAPGRRVARIGGFATGEISAVFEIETADGPSFILKVYPETLNWKMRKEVLVARLLEGRTGVPVPRILLTDDSRSLLDLDFLVMNRLEGETVIAREPGLDAADTQAIYGQMGRALREIHAVTMEAFGYIGPGGIVTPFATNRAYMLSQFERKLGGFAELGGRPALAEQLSTYLKHSAGLLEGCAEPHLCHYDFHTGNLLAASRGGRLQLTGIVDLENAIAGDPLMDLAKTLSYSVRDDATKRAGLFEGYGPIERPNWEATLRLYQFYGAIELWAWWTQIGDRHRADHIVADLEKYLS